MVQFAGSCCTQQANEEKEAKWELKSTKQVPCLNGIRSKSHDQNHVTIVDTRFCGLLLPSMVFLATRGF